MVSLLRELRSEKLVDLPACALCGSNQHTCLQQNDACTVPEARETPARCCPICPRPLSKSDSHVSVLTSSVLCHTGLIYGAEAHLVTNLTVNGQYHLVVFGKYFWTNVSHLLMVYCGHHLVRPYLLNRVARPCCCSPAGSNRPFQSCCMECFWHCLPLVILGCGASSELACLALAGVWMNMAGNKTNDFYAQLEPYVNSGEGAVGRISHNELFPSCRFSQTISNL